MSTTKPRAVRLGAAAAVDGFWAKEGSVTHTEGTVGRQVYRRSAAKEIGVLDAIEELLAAAEDEAKIEQLKRLRALMQAYQQRRAKRL